MSLLFKDFVQAVGSIISTFVVLYNLYITKFLSIFFRIKLESINSKRSVNKSGNRIYDNTMKYTSNCKLYSNNNSINNLRAANSNNMIYGSNSMLNDNINGSVRRLNTNNNGSKNVLPNDDNNYINNVKENNCDDGSTEDIN